MTDTDTVDTTDLLDGIEADDHQAVPADEIDTDTESEQ